MKNIVIFASLIFVLPWLSKAQSFERDITIPVTINGNLLENPWSGGIDAPEYSAIDLNGDNIKDLFVFDRRSNRISTFINNGTQGQIDYHYAPQYISAFPELINWAQLVDFNCDGKEDIFTDANSGSIKVYLNVTTTSLQFALFDTMLLSDYGSSLISNIYCPSHGLASFADIDGDSDLDILTPSVAPGVTYHKNLSFDLYGTCDSLKFVMDNWAWGGINFGGGGNESRHYLAIDIDADGDKDLLTNNLAVITSLNYDIIKYYENYGNAQVANLILSADTFPNVNDPAAVRGFAAAFEFDADNDSKSDIIIAPQLNSFHDIDNSWFIKDTSSTSLKSFETVTNNFLCSGMIDVGTVANVRFHDIDDDGLTDIIIGNFMRQPQNGNDSSSLYYFRNTGTLAVPAFDLITDNLANTISPAYMGMSPTFGDLDGDMDNDMLVGLYDGSISQYINNSGVFSFVSGNYQGIDVGFNNAPYLFDVDMDGLTDLICGSKTGKLQYFRNTGTVSAPVFTLETSYWGNVDLAYGSSPFGYSYPVIYSENGAIELLVGCESGTVFRYGNITGNLMGAFALLDSMYAGINEKQRATIDVIDINNDSQLDILTGNYNGGAVIYKKIPTSIADLAGDTTSLIIFPIPASSKINVKCKGNTSVQILNMFGEILIDKFVDSSEIVEVAISGLSNGVYFVKAGNKCSKLIVNH